MVNGYYSGAISLTGHTAGEMERQGEVVFGKVNYLTIHSMVDDVPKLTGDIGPFALIPTEIDLYGEGIVRVLTGISVISRENDVGIVYVLIAESGMNTVGYLL